MEMTKVKIIWNDNVVLEVEAQGTLMQSLIGVDNRVGLNMRVQEPNGHSAHFLISSETLSPSHITQLSDRIESLVREYIDNPF